MSYNWKTKDTLELLEQLKEPISSKEFAEARQITRHQAAQKLLACKNTFGVLRCIGTVRNPGSSQTSPLYAKTPRLAVCLAIVRAGKRQPLRVERPKRKTSPAPKMSAVELAWRAERAAMNLPEPMDPHASTVSHAVAMSQ